MCVCVCVCVLLFHPLKKGWGDPPATHSHTDFSIFRFGPKNTSETTHTHTHIHTHTDLHGGRFSPFLRGEKIRPKSDGFVRFWCPAWGPGPEGGPLSLRSSDRFVRARRARSADFTVSGAPGVPKKGENPPTLVGVFRQKHRSSEARGAPPLARAPRPVPNPGFSPKFPQIPPEMCVSALK